MMAGLTPPTTAPPSLVLPPHSCSLLTHAPSSLVLPPHPCSLPSVSPFPPLPSFSCLFFTASLMWSSQTSTMISGLSLLIHLHRVLSLGGISVHPALPYVMAGLNVCVCCCLKTLLVVAMGDEFRIFFEFLKHSLYPTLKRPPWRGNGQPSEFPIPRTLEKFTFCVCLVWHAASCSEYCSMQALVQGRTRTYSVKSHFNSISWPAQQHNGSPSISQQEHL